MYICKQGYSMKLRNKILKWVNIINYLPKHEIHDICLFVSWMNIHVACRSPFFACDPLKHSKTSNSRSVRTMHSAFQYWFSTSPPPIVKLKRCFIRLCLYVTWKQLNLRHQVMQVFIHEFRPVAEKGRRAPCHYEPDLAPLPYSGVPRMLDAKL